jgi:hypothetical protein
MSYGGYSVEIGALRAVSGQLRHDAEHVGTIRASLADAAVPDSAFGSSDLSRTAVDAWRTALTAFDRRLTRVSHRLTHEAATLTSVAADYERVDQHVASLFHRLHQGASGPAVVELQRRLHDAGINPGPIDGQYGPLTAHAVTEYERRHPNL